MEPAVVLRNYKDSLAGLQQELSRERQLRTAAEAEAKQLRRDLLTLQERLAEVQFANQVHLANFQTSSAQTSELEQDNKVLKTRLDEACQLLQNQEAQVRALRQQTVTCTDAHEMAYLNSQLEYLHTELKRKDDVIRQLERVSHEAQAKLDSQMRELSLLQASTVPSRKRKKPKVMHCHKQLKHLQHTNKTLNQKNRLLHSQSQRLKRKVTTLAGQAPKPSDTVLVSINNDRLRTGSSTTLPFNSVRHSMQPELSTDSREVREYFSELLLKKEEDVHRLHQDRERLQQLLSEMQRQLTQALGSKRKLALNQS